MFDIVIVSDGSNKRNINMTKNCIESILISSHFDNKIIVVEKNDNIKYDNVVNLHYDFDFNYNKCLNYGIDNTTSDYICLANNDLIFQTDWDKNIIKALLYCVGSASPYCMKSHNKLFDMGENVVVGNRIGKEMAGWCICLKRSTLEAIGGKLNESVNFWYSDDIYVEQLKKAGIKHGLVCNSFVTHLGSKTLSQKSYRDKHFMTRGQKQKFENEVKKMWMYG